MEMGSILHLLNFFFMLITASVPAYLAFRVLGSNRRLLYLSTGLTAFALVHASYHFAEYIELVDFADDYLLPLSVMLLVLYGLYYLRSGL